MEIYALLYDSRRGFGEISVRGGKGLFYSSLRFVGWSSAVLVALSDEI